MAATSGSGGAGGDTAGSSGSGATGGTNGAGGANGDGGGSGCGQAEALCGVGKTSCCVGETFVECMSGSTEMTACHAPNLHCVQMSLASENHPQTFGCAATPNGQCDPELPLCLFVNGLEYSYSDVCSAQDPAPYGKYYACSGDATCVQSTSEPDHGVCQEAACQEHNTCSGNVLHYCSGPQGEKQVDCTVYGANYTCATSSFEDDATCVQPGATECGPTNPAPVCDGNSTVQCTGGFTHKVDCESKTCVEVVPGVSQCQ